MNKLKISDTVRHLVGMLVAGDYAGLEAVSRGRRLTAEQLREAWEEYGGDLRLPGVPARELQMPPESVFETSRIRYRRIPPSHSTPAARSSRPSALSSS